MWRQWHLRAQQANGPESGVWRHAICEHGKEELVCSCKKFKVILVIRIQPKKHVELSCKYYRCQLDLCQGSRWLASVVMASRRRAPCISLDLSRSNARVRSDLHSPNDAWTSQAHGLAAATLCSETRDPRDEAGVPRAGWPARPRLFRQESEGSEAAGFAFVNAQFLANQHGCKPNASIGAIGLNIILWLG